MGRSEKDLNKQLVMLRSTMSDLQYRLYIERKRSLLVVLQGMDASGKDGAIKDVMSAFNPIGCYVKAFKVPTPDELSHDFLWRIHNAVPPKGVIGVFNRSHYEDVVEARVGKLVPRTVWEPRYDQIIQFEKTLHENDVKIIKFFLHISKQEQKERLCSRLLHPRKRWKVNRDDFEKRKKWGRYMEAYQDAIVRSSTRESPWYIVPANKKWFRNWFIAKTIIQTLNGMKIKNPKYEMPPNIGNICR
jgi:PPK2 family polyphosphate:nucleotide phosphotransferase